MKRTLGTFALAVVLLAPVPTAQAATPALNWTDCQDGFRCATASVPLDHDRPNGTKIDLAVIKLPAADPGKRIGTLFVNFGGPGTPGVERLRQRGNWPWLFSAELRARFDLVSWDPRGIGRSATVRCFDSVAQQEAFLGSIPDFPAEAGDEEAFYAKYRDLAQRCEDRNGDLLDHVSTANTARDLDRLRHAVGDRKLTYHGISYGTHLGAVYANLFPNRVRAMVFDGSMDFVGNATGHDGQGKTTPLDTRQDVPRGIAETFDQFLSQCVEPGADCAFAGGDPRTKWEALVARVKQAPITTPDGETFDYDSLIGRVNGDLLVPEDWKDTARLLEALHAAGSGYARPLGEPYVANRTEAFNAIQCTDSDFPRDPAVYTAFGASEDRRVPHWGRIAVFGMMGCAFWQGHDADRYTGPWNRWTSAPILVLNNRYDPATPLHGARDGAAELARARVFVVEGAGHSTMLTRSTCAEKVKRDYLVSGILPPADATCGIDRKPFAPAA